MSEERIARAILEYAGDSIELLAGESMVGRGLDCRIRFNDQAISRRQFRLSVAPEQVVIEDLKSRNGTRINGALLREAQPLKDGDLIEFGSRSLRLRLVSEDDDLDDHVDETTISDWQALNRAKRGPTLTEQRLQMPQTPSTAPLPETQNCTKCLNAVQLGETYCPKCGHRWPPGRATSPTIELPAAHHERRREPRVPVDIPVLYSSETLTFDAHATSLSATGVFIKSPIGDPVETTCRVTLLPDGGQAVTLGGVIRHVVKGDATTEGGVGIEFTGLSQESEEWLHGITEA